MLGFELTTLQDLSRNSPTFNRLVHPGSSSCYFKKIKKEEKCLERRPFQSCQLVTHHSRRSFELQVPESSAPLPSPTKGGNQAPRCTTGSILNLPQNENVVVAGLHFPET